MEVPEKPGLEGLEDKWADAFRDLYREPPSWYSSPNYRNSFSPNTFVSDLGRFRVYIDAITSQKTLSNTLGFARMGS